MLENNDTKKAFANYFVKGLDTVSVPCIHLQNSSKAKLDISSGEISVSQHDDILDRSPLCLNLEAKESEGIRRRDGVQLLPNNLDSDVLGMSRDTRSGDVFYIAKAPSSNAYVLKRIFKNNGTVVVSPEFSIAGSPSQIRFKVISRYPSTTNNLFLYGVSNEGDRINLQTTFVNGVFSSVVPNTTLSASGLTTPLVILDHEMIGNRLFLLVQNGNEFRLVFGTTTSLNEFYIIPSIYLPTAIFSSENNMFVGCENQVLKIAFNDTYTQTSPLVRLLDNLGVKDAYSYCIVSINAYIFSISAFYKLDLTSRIVLDENSVCEFIDSNISNLSPQMKIYKAFYRADQKMVCWSAAIDSEFVFKSLYLFARNIQGYNKSSLEYYQENYQKKSFMICYSIEKKAWFLHYYNEEILSYDIFAYKYNEKYCESIVATPSGIYIAHRDFQFDNVALFPVLFIPRVKNEEILTGGVMLLRRVTVAYTNSRNPFVDNQNNSITCCPVLLNQNIIREDHENIFDGISVVSKAENKGINIYEYKPCLSSRCSNALVCIASNAVESLAGVLTLSVVAGRIT